MNWKSPLASRNSALALASAPPACGRHCTLLAPWAGAAARASRAIDFDGGTGASGRGTRVGGRGRELQGATWPAERLGGPPAAVAAAGRARAADETNARGETSCGARRGGRGARWSRAQWAAGSQIVQRRRVRREPPSGRSERPLQALTARPRRSPAREAAARRQTIAACVRSSRRAAAACSGSTPPALLWRRRPTPPAGCPARLRRRTRRRPRCARSRGRCAGPWRRS